MDVKPLPTRDEVAAEECPHCKAVAGAPCINQGFGVVVPGIFCERSAWLRWRGCPARLPGGAGCRRELGHNGKHKPWRPRLFKKSRRGARGLPIFRGRL